MDRRVSDTAWPSGDAITKFRENVEFHLSILGASADRTIAELLLAARNFQSNCVLDAQSKAASHLKRELAELAGMSGPALERRIAALGEFEWSAFFGEMPGAMVELSIDGVHHRRLLPDDERLVGASFKTLARHGDDGVAPTGLVHRRRSDGLAGCIPHDASIEDLARLLAGLAGMALDPSMTTERQDHLFSLVVGPLLAAGSLGDGALLRALTERLAKATPDERFVLLEEIAPLCLQDVDEASTGGGRALACLVLQEVAGQAWAAERKQLLMLLARIFPQALAGYAGVLADRVDTQYRLEQSPRSGRRDARRWHEAHAGWKLIDEVLDVVWPTERREPGWQERNAVVSILWQIIAFADEGQRRPKPPTRRVARPDSKDRHGTIKAAGDHDEVPNVGNHMVNEDHVKQLIALRGVIGKIDVVLGILDRKALFELEPTACTDTHARRELADLRRDIDALQSWRRELEHKRERGEYERVKLTEPRATGARVLVLRTPQVKTEALAAGDEVAIAKIVAAAHAMRSRPE